MQRDHSNIFVSQETWWWFWPRWKQQRLEIVKGPDLLTGDGV